MKTLARSQYLDGVHREIRSDETRTSEANVTSSLPRQWSGVPLYSEWLEGDLQLSIRIEPNCEA
jgi:hypothetical protein